MARINVDDELRADPRFTSLCTIIPRHEAFGALVCLWEVGQSYWKKGESLIPQNIFDLLPHCSDLVRVGFGVCSENGVYCVGARERWGFLLARKEAGKRSAEARKQKYGSAIPVNGTNNRTKSEQPPNKTEHSSSSSSSSSNSIQYRPTASQSDPDFDLFWKEYPNKKAKVRAFQIWKNLKIPKERKPMILGALQKQKQSEQWARDGGRFIPHPATWLNQRRWEDEDANVIRISEREKMLKILEDV